MDEWGPQLRAFVWFMQAAYGLTRREGEILYYLCCGLTEVKRTCRVLCCTDDTIKNHRKAIYRKLGVYDRTGAVLAAWPVFDAATRTPVAA